MRISFSPPTRINDVLLPADAQRLSCDELHLTIPSDVRMVESDMLIVLDDVPLLGLVAQLVDACEQTFAGAERARALDLYGTYELEYWRGAGVLEERVSRQAVRVGIDELCRAVAEFAAQAFDAVSAAWPSMNDNSAFATLRSQYGGDFIRR